MTVRKPPRGASSERRRRAGDGDEVTRLLAEPRRPILAGFVSVLSHLNVAPHHVINTSRLFLASPLSNQDEDVTLVGVEHAHFLADVGHSPRPRSTLRERFSHQLFAKRKRGGVEEGHLELIGL
jgi:hypothetical protein